MRQVHDRYGVAAAKTTRIVLSGMVGLAVRYDALDRNPVATSDASKARVRWNDLDFDACTVTVNGTVVRVKGAGLMAKPPKSASGRRTLELSGWDMVMLRRRRQRCRPNDWDVVFTAPTGGLRDPSNTQADLRVVFAAAGYAWVTSHIYRKTVAALMDGAGLRARQAHDQLGHAKVSMTQDNYFGRNVARTGAAGLLEIFGGVELDASPGGEPGADQDHDEPSGS